MNAVRLVVASLTILAMLGFQEFGALIWLIKNSPSGTTYWGTDLQHLSSAGQAMMDRLNHYESLFSACIHGILALALLELGYAVLRNWDQWCPAHLSAMDRWQMQHSAVARRYLNERVSPWPLTKREWADLKCHMQWEDRQGSSSIWLPHPEWVANCLVTEAQVQLRAGHRKEA